jgi:uncharacterized membrane protein YecN with MAPEG domain
MEYIAVVTMLALIEYLIFQTLVGRARRAYGVAAPATTGNATFERYYRVQQNTIEQLVVFLPSLWLFGLFTNPVLGALIGLVYIIGRVLYLRGYVSDPDKRGLGFALGFMATAILALGALGGAIVAAL